MQSTFQVSPYVQSIAAYGSINTATFAEKHLGHDRNVFAELNRATKIALDEIGTVQINVDLIGVAERLLSTWHETKIGDVFHEVGNSWQLFCRLDPAFALGKYQEWTVGQFLAEHPMDFSGHPEMVTGDSVSMTLLELMHATPYAGTGWRLQDGTVFYLIA